MFIKQYVLRILTHLYVSSQEPNEVGYHLDWRAEELKLREACDPPKVTHSEAD